MKPSRVTCTVLILVLFATSAAQESEPPKTPINTMCPVLTDEPVTKGITAEWEGKTIGFCCPTCRRKFLAEPAKYIANLPGFGAVGEAGEPKAATAPTGSAATGWIERLGRFHPLAIHFPIALVLVALLLEAVPILAGAPSRTAAGRTLLVLAAASAVVAAGLGWAAADRKEFPAGLAAVLPWHRWLGTAAAGMLVALLVLLARARRRPDSAGRRWAFRLGLLAAAALVTAAGHFGATLVWGAGYLLGG